MPNVIIYSTPSCVYCKMAKELFKEHNVAYEEKNVISDEKLQQEMIEKSGQLGVPVIDVGGQIVVGYDKETLEELLGIKVKEGGKTTCMACSHPHGKENGTCDCGCDK